MLWTYDILILIHGECILNLWNSILKDMLSNVLYFYRSRSNRDLNYFITSLNQKFNLHFNLNWSSSVGLVLKKRPKDTHFLQE